MTTYDDIRTDFELLDDWEDRYRYIIELGRKLPPLPASAKTEANKVRGCASQVWLDRTLDGTAGTPDVRLLYAGESDSHIVQGLIAILLALANGATAQEILAMDIGASFAGLGLNEHLTPQRSNGFASMVERIRADARAAIAG